MHSAAQQARLDILPFEHFKKVRALCTTEQQIKFDQIIEQAMQMLAPPQNPGGPAGLPPPPQK